ncbi:hypothetical protein NOR_01831 [Metarhizium rileyi]|uniref:Uncharacterized protein n=1 Tax=Metarhizium rileyi (strain RCEF 4871) TaxID=1649241 RepID=A0A167I210_METRR|nr:hypothetical protein NOR_01831 [Metarhizium rileyi RCEF 4871]TWU74399.1 hypothetical protein ED733_002799 [Metarhizium rileyi]
MPTHVNGLAKPRFELPALDLNFGSITDGTNIPPPPDSPKVPTPPQTPPPTKGSDAAVADAVNGDGDETDKSTPPKNGNTAGSKRPADEAPLSPAGSARQGSLRKLFSRNMLNTSYTEGALTALENGSLANGSRPPSRGASSVMGGRKSRRSSWFGLFKSGESKRSSILFEDTTISPNRKPSGPPPPMIPELKDLEKDEGSLGNDLFKNIK